jgi:hypothetical protein
MDESPEPSTEPTPGVPPPARGPYHVAVRMAFVAGLILVVGALMVFSNRIPVLEDVIGGGGVPCLSPSTVCDPDLSPKITVPPPSTTRTTVPPV